MIRITLKNVASFGESTASLETDKKINLIYGLNGTGKTTISDFLYYREEDSKFRECALDGVNDEKILVYNKNFIQDNFYDKDELKGVFTLSRENREAEEAIRKANEEKAGHQRKKEEQEQTKERHENELGQEFNRTQNVIWEIKNKYTGGDRPLQFCLDGLRGEKEKLFNHLNDIPVPSQEPSKTINMLEDEARSISEESAQEHESLKPISIDVRDIEENPIFSETIVGNENSSVADFIKKLGNSDWVKQGLNYLPHNISTTREQCPFCQEKTITKEVVQNIKSYFGGEYEGKIAQLKEIEKEYNQVLLPEDNSYKNHPLTRGDKDQMENLYHKLQSSLNENLQKIKSKINKPSQSVTLSSTENEQGNLNKLIETINEKIQEHNRKIRNKAQTKKDIKETFWQIMRWEYRHVLSQYDQARQRINNKIKEIDTNLSKTATKIQEQEGKVTEQQRNMVNIEEAINNINRGLIDIGIDGFRIEKYSENSYRIIREGHSDNQFSTLSEGEKMVISFLYFMELCKGRESKEESETDKIVVIDDPISSMSHIYIFNLSQWIKRQFVDSKYKSVFVLTHSLYFFNELMKKREEKNQKLFRLTKSSRKDSQIHEMGPDEIQNEYQSYWQIMKDHNEGRASDILLPNVMRNILEHFFGFISKENFKKAIENIDDTKYAAFIRFISRESHSDPVNIFDMKEIDVDLFKQAFKEVFKKSGYQEHYDKMMGQEKSK